MAKQTINGDIELNGAVLGDATNIVFYSKEQQLTEQQKQQARENIGAAAEGDTPEPYVLPAATTSTLGGIIVGTGLSVSSDGTLAVSGSGQSVDWNDIANKPTFSSVATSGDYDDLSNTPTIPTSTSELTNDSGFITSSDIPTIPTKTSDLTNDSNFVSDGDYNHTDNNFTDQDLTKLNSIETGAEANVQSDWNQTNTSADDYIKNKPTIPSPYTLPVATASTLGGIKVGTGLSISGDGTLAVSGSGQSVDWDDIENKPTFASVATSGDYDDLSNTPTIPTSTSELTNDSGFITSSEIPTIPTSTSDLTNDSGFITIEDIPTIPTKTSELTNDSGFITNADLPEENFMISVSMSGSTITADKTFAQITAAYNAGKFIYVKAPNAFSITYVYNYFMLKNIDSHSVTFYNINFENYSVHTIAIQRDDTVELKTNIHLMDWSAISDKPVFSTVATTGSYTDLTNRPTIPTVATYSVIITRSEWTRVGDHIECTKRVEGLSASSTIIASPAPNSMINAGFHQVFVSNQTDDAITFSLFNFVTTESIPTFQFDLVEMK